MASKLMVILLLLMILSFCLFMGWGTRGKENPTIVLQLYGKLF